MRLVAALFAAAVAAAAVAQDGAAPAPRRIDIVPPYKDIEVALDAHLASGDYDPQVDARLSVDLANAHAREADYTQAKNVLEDALRRNRKADDDPLVGAYLHDTLANVEAHRGELAEQRKHRQASFDALREVFGESHEAVGLAKLRFANAVLAEAPENPSYSISPLANMQMGGIVPQIVRYPLANTARDMLADVEATAAGAQGPTHPLTLLARFNRVELEIGQGAFDDAQALLTGAVDSLSAAPETPPQFLFRAVVLEAQLRRAEGDPAGVEAAIARLLEMRLEAPEPILVLEFDYDSALDESASLAYQAAVGNGLDAGRGGQSRIAGSWVDIGYCVTDKGRVADIKIVGHHGSTAWHDGLVTELVTRRYYPRTVAGAFDDCAYRLQRFTAEAATIRWTGSRLKRKSAYTYLLVEDRLDDRGVASPLFNGN